MNISKKIAIRMVLIFVLGSILSFGPSAISVTQKIQDAQKALEEGNYLLQGEILLDLAHENPWWNSLWELAGDAFFKAGNFPHAIPPYETAMELNTLSVPGMLNLGASYQAAGDFLSAEATWGIIDENPEALYSLAILYEESGDLKSAIETWDRYLSLVSDADPELIFHVALLLAAENPPEALVLLERSKETNPAALDIHSAIEQALSEEKAYQFVSSGQALAANDEWKLAVFAFEKAVSLRPDYPEAYLYWGEALQHVPEPESDPLDILEQGLALDEKSPLANLFLGLYWQREGSHAKALEFFNIVEQAWPDRAEIYVEQGRSQGALGELETALGNFQKAIDMDPDEAIYYRELTNFCVVYSYQVREIGLPAARMAVQLNDQDPANLDSMGQVMLSLEDHFNASQFFLRALDIDPTFSLAAYHLGIMYSAQNNSELTVYYLQQVMSHSSNPAIRDQVERLLSTYR
jgi:tetratricopeptide (TPR) repeat protein